MAVCPRITYWMVHYFYQVLAPPCHVLIYHVYVGPSFWILHLFHWCNCLCFCYHTVLITIALLYVFISNKSCLLLFQDYLWSFTFYVNFKNSLSASSKYPAGLLIGIALIFTLFGRKLPSVWYWICPSGNIINLTILKTSSLISFSKVLSFSIQIFHISFLRIISRYP